MAPDDADRAFEPARMPDAVFDLVESALEAPSADAARSALARIPEPWRSEAAATIAARAEATAFATAHAGADRRSDAPSRQAGVLAAGTRLGDYIVSGLLGKGGQGSVYRAYDQRLGRSAALKIVDLSGPDAPARFARLEREATLLARVDHPNLCQVYGVGRSGDLAWIAMRCVEGRSAEEVLDADRLLPDGAELARRLGWVRAVARALGAAHDAGVTHRDVKPANILIGADDVPYLADFGLAKSDACAPELTTLGATLGTPAYMAPEQIAGTKASVDPRTDVWGLGATLYELALGRPPFEAPSRERLFHAILSEEPAPPRRRNPAVSRDLETVILGALAKDPGHRYASASLMADDLDRIAAGRAPAMRSVGAIGRLLRWSRRNPSTAAAALTAILALTTAAVTAAVMLAQAQRDRDALRQTLDLAQGHRLTASAQAAAETAPGKAAVMALEGHRRAGSGAAAEALLEAFDKKVEESAFLGHQDGLVDVRISGSGHWALSASPHAVALWEIDDERPLIEWRFDDETVTAAAFAQADGIVLVATKSGGVAGLATDDGRALWAKALFHGAVTAVAVGATGTVAAASEDGSAVLFTVERTGATIERTIGPLGAPQLGAGFDRSGERLALTGANGRVAVFEVRSGEKTVEFATAAWEVKSPAFSPDGRLLALAHSDNQLWIVDANDGRIVARRRGHASGLESVAFSPDGKRLLSTSYDRTALIWNTESWAIAERLTGHAGAVTVGAFTPDGARVVTGSSDRTARIWRLGEPLRWYGFDITPGALGRVVASRDGGTLASTDLEGGLSLMRAADGGMRRALAPLDDGEPLVDIEFSPDGRQVAGVSMSGAVRLYATEDGRTLATIDPRSGARAGAASLLFSPDGRLLVIAGSDDRARVYDVALGRVVREVPGVGPHYPNGLVKRLAFSDDGLYLALVRREDDWSTTAVYRTDDWSLVDAANAHESMITTLLFLPRTHRLVSGSVDGLVRQVSIDGTRAPLDFRLEPPAGLVGIRADASGARLVVATQHDRVFCFDAGRGRLEWASPAHMGVVYDAAFSSDGARVLTVGWDGTANILAAATGAKLFTNRRHGRPLTSGAFVGDGASIVTTSIDGRVRFWPADPVRAAADLIRRGFTPSEALELGLDAPEVPRAKRRLQIPALPRLEKSPER